MTVPRVLRPALVAIVAAGLTLTACTSPDPAPEPTVTQTTEPAPEPTTDPTEVAAPEQPALMATNDAIGARAAAEYFLSLYGYVFQTGDLTAWDAMCDPLSEFCNGVRERAREAESAGSQYRGGSVTTIVNTVTEPSDAIAFFEVAGVLTQAPSETLDAGGAVVEAREVASEASFSVFLQMDPAGSWIVRAVDIGETE